LFGGGGSTNSVEDRENGDLGAVATLVRGSGGSCNLVQGISFHIFLLFNSKLHRRLNVITPSLWRLISYLLLSFHIVKFS